MKKKSVKRSKAAVRPQSKDYPKGWTRKRIDAVAKYYDSQSDEEGTAELEAAFRNEAFAMIQVPIKLVPQVQKLLARRAG